MVKSRGIEVVARVLSLIFLFSWATRVIWHTQIRSRVLVIIRADAIGHLALHTPYVLQELKAVHSQSVFGADERSILVAPDGGVANDALWKLFVIARVENLKFRSRTVVDRMVFSRRWGVFCSIQSRRGFYRLFDGRYLDCTNVVDAERRILSRPKDRFASPATLLSAYVGADEAAKIVATVVPEASDMRAVLDNRTRPVVLAIDRDGEYRGESACLRDTIAGELETVIAALLDQGFFVVRMGSKRRSPARVKDEHFFDYALCAERSAEWDVLLSSIAAAAISWDTGLAHLPQLFGVPVWSLVSAKGLEIAGFERVYLPWVSARTGAPVSLDAVMTMIGSRDPDEWFRNDLVSQVKRRPINRIEARCLALSVRRTVIG